MSLRNGLRWLICLPIGVRLARLAYEQPDVPSVDAQHLHVFFELGDHLGSTSVVLDKATSELVERSTYEAYGSTESDYRPERWKGFREDYKFTSKETDIEVGLAYFGRRFYAPMLQRWVSADPLAVHAAGEADLNLYAYVSGRALKSVDPLGLEGEIRVNVAPPGVKEGQRYIVVPAGQGGVAPTKKFKQAAKGQPVFIYDPVRGTDPETAITIWSAGQELGGKKGSALQDFLIGAALISGESTDAIKTDGTGSVDGVPGGGCSVNCVSGKGVQGAYVIAAAAAVVSGARVGAKVVGKGAEKVGEAVASVGQKVTKAVKAAKRRLHANSRLSSRAQHGYEIVDTKTGKVVKTGVSSGRRTRAGGSYRANSQANRWNRQSGEPGRYQGRVVKEVSAGPGARQEILKWERRNASQLRKTGQLNDPYKHKRP